MPRQDLIQLRRGTKAQFDALTSGNKLEVGEPGVATDTEELLIGLGPTVDPFVVAASGTSYFILSGGAYIGGLATGDARGTGAIDIQSSRSNNNQVASVENSIIFGRGSRVTGQPHVAIGNGNTLTGTGGESVGVGVAIESAASSSVVFARVATLNSGCGFVTALGTGVTATDVSEGVVVGFSSSLTGNQGILIGLSSSLTTGGTPSVSIGTANTSSVGVLCVGLFCDNTGSASTILGWVNNNSGATSTLIGNSINNTVNDTFNVRHNSARIRAHGATGMVSQSVQNRATTYGDGGGTEGSEADNTIGREMFAIRRNGNEFLLDFNDAGTIKTLSLGSVS